MKPSKIKNFLGPENQEDSRGGGKIIVIAMLAFFALIASKMAFAIPVPSGIDGIIYELDGVTQVRSGIDFYVKNEANGKTIYGKTGHGNSGRYSVSISGNTGDLITIKAWNKYNQVNGTLSLDGVMKGANLFLNMTYPPIAPEIISIPSENAAEDMIYIYEVLAFDENEDALQYSIAQGPDGMKIEENLLTWIPENEDVGMHNVTVQVSDGIYIVSQSFLVFVKNTNDEVIITSTAPTEIKIGEQYSYQVAAIDADNDPLSYSLVISPPSMSIGSSGIILWKPKGYDKGQNKVVVAVSDGASTVHQEFSINVIASENKEQSQGGSGGGSGGGGGNPNIASIKRIEGERKSVVAVKLPVNSQGVRIEDLSERPKDAKRLDRKVYRYLIIENVKQIKINDTKGAEINFTVDGKWLSENQINPSEIIMTRYNNNSWQDLETFNVSNDGKYIHYIARTPGFSYFAISVKEGVKAANDLKPEISKIDAPFRFTGIVHKFLLLGQAEIGTKIFFENLNTGKTYAAITGEGPNSGAYYLFVEGNGNDPVRITIEGARREIVTQLKDTELSFMLNARKTGFVPITGNAFTAIMKDSTAIWALALMLALAVVFRAYKFHKK